MIAIIFLGLLAVTCADYSKTLVRAPEHDSAIIQSHRLGGNFAYSTHEGHAYKQSQPIIGHRTVPVGVTYQKEEPIVYSQTSYVNAEIPQVGYSLPTYSSDSYGLTTNGLYGSQGYPLYGYGQNNLYGQYSGAAVAPAYSYGLTGLNNGYSYGASAVVPGYSTGTTGNVYNQHVASPSYSYETGPVYGTETVLSHGNNHGAYGYESVPVHTRKTVVTHGHGHKGGYDSKTVVHKGGYDSKTIVSHGHKDDGHHGHYSIETPVYKPDYSLSYAPHSYAPVYPHKVKTHTTVVKGRKYKKGYSSHY